MESSTAETARTASSKSNGASVALGAWFMWGSLALACSGGATTSSGSGTGSGGDASTGLGSASTSQTATGSGGAGGSVEAPPSVFTVEETDHHRDRLLDTLAQRRGAVDRCALWSAMTTVERGIFLTHTDMLGHRSCFDDASVSPQQMNGGTCDASGCTCSTSLPCACPVGSVMALDHVFETWAVNGSDTSCCAGNDCCNGGGEWHRTFFSADDQLIAAFRDIEAGLPEWANSNDFGGPHAPFTQSGETQQGSPRGQTHFWSFDTQASVLSRNGVVGVYDPHIVEIDNDYNILHDSNPEGTYSFTYGRAEYKNHWNASGAGNRGDGLPTSYAGNGAPSNISELVNDAVWSPTCGPTISVGGVSPIAGGTPQDLHVGAKIVVEGSGFAGSGNRVHIRSRSMAVALDQGSPLLMSESSTSIVLQLPKDIGTGEGFVYVETGGVLSNLQPVTLNP